MNPAKLYLQVREKEGRLYSDQIVMHLPVLPNEHIHHTEWLARADSATRLVNYLSRLPSPIFILELGCGNGWLSHKISTIPNTRIWGLDRYSSELKQAARLFDYPNTGFLCSNILQSPFIRNSFDVIILASVIQYFENLPALILQLQTLLTKRGEIHLLDSPIYNKKGLIAARERTQIYYDGLGYQEMANHYFHHTIDELNEFHTHWLYRPNGWYARKNRLLGGTPSPFPWLYIS